MVFGLLKILIVRKDPIRSEKVGQRLGRFLMRVGKKHRNRAIKNLRLAYPELTEPQRLDLARRCFEHFGMVASDFLRAPIRSDKEILESISIESTDVYSGAVAEGKGVLIVTAHFGNWERSAAYVGLTHKPIVVVQRDANNSALTQQMTKLREQSKAEVLSRGNAIRAILGALKEGRSVAILPDQNASDDFVPFFGHPAGTVLGPAVLHLRTGAPVIIAFCARTGPGKYAVHMERLPELSEEHRNPHDIMAMIHAAIEREIRKHPEQWLWLHDRWKSARRRGMVPDL